ncbi:MAG: NAD(+)/NADH kinase [Calditerrivibrio sp.]|nr:NAD(+)/NADH kinase [Calditerrivibrio sp.]MCA1932983.1 NAD(+)/NADH kinase [Calditerrivibrio sp.]
MKSLAIVAKPHAENIYNILTRLVGYLKNVNITPLLEERAAYVINAVQSSHQEIRDNADMLIVLGGDGTLISSIRIIDNKEIPILGVNLGRLGFLTETRIEELESTLDRILSGDYKTEQRLKLCSRVLLGGVETFKSSVINDIVINKGALARIIDIDVYIDEHFVNTYRADGLIISTPTGSTAYNLAAGGPIVYPTQNNIIITPICPHSLSNRPIVVDGDVEIRLKVKNDDERVFLTYDGQIGKRLTNGEEVVIKKSSYYVNLIVSSNRNYFSLLREKLGWGGN